MKTPSNASIRRAITTLKKAEMLLDGEDVLIFKIERAIENKSTTLVIGIRVPWNLLTPKKTRKKALKYKSVKVTEVKNFHVDNSMIGGDNPLDVTF